MVSSYEKSRTAVEDYNSSSAGIIVSIEPLAVMAMTVSLVCRFFFTEHLPIFQPLFEASRRIAILPRFSVMIIIIISSVALPANVYKSQLFHYHFSF